MESSEDAHISRGDLIFIASLFIFIYLSLYIVFTSAVPAGEGLGWDGRVYGALAADFSGALERGVIDDYRVNRLVPSLLVWMGRTAIGVTDDSPSTVAKQFQEYNILIISISFFIMTHLSIYIRLGRNATFVLISFMFVNFAALKLWIFVAPQTDTTAFFSACCWFCQ
ncbi:MAG: hypothetical protein J0H11_02660 [Rhizobiales bacterium]|nr:hypothetical protein [Hyphomicrobiales bacterium]